MREDVVFKGNRAGLQLLFSDAVEFETIMVKLRVKLSSASHFFHKGAVIQIAAGTPDLTEPQLARLAELFAEYGLELQTAAAALQGKEAPPIEPEENVVIARTVRGGQEIVNRGSIVVFGDVNPGAKVIAGGNIEIHGACRGIVHAGAFGDAGATITADRLLATQIRIADLIARPPDGDFTAGRTEVARIKDGCIVIHSLNK